MKTIFKAVIECQNINSKVPTKTVMPSGAKVLSAHNQDDNISVWFEIETSINDLTTYNIVSIGTGFQSQHFDKGIFVGTVLGNYDLVHHIYVWEEKDD